MRPLRKFCLLVFVASLITGPCLATSQWSPYYARLLPVDTIFDPAFIELEYSFIYLEVPQHLREAYEEECSLRACVESEGGVMYLGPECWDFAGRMNDTFTHRIAVQAASGDSGTVCVRTYLGERTVSKSWLFFVPTDRGLQIRNAPPTFGGQLLAGPRPEPVAKTEYDILLDLRGHPRLEEFEDSLAAHPNGLPEAPNQYRPTDTAGVFLMRGTADVVRSMLRQGLKCRFLDDSLNREVLDAVSPDGHGTE